MTLVRWSPWRGAMSVQDEMSRLFNGLVTSPSGSSGVKDWAPSVDISETDDGFIVTADVPGMTADDIKISVANNVLTLRGEKKNIREGDGENFHRVERIFGSFERTFSLPTGVESGNVKAKYRNGVLEVRIPKSVEAKPQEIKVEA
jgi:HSP20 family protein